MEGCLCTVECSLGKVSLLFQASSRLRVLCLAEFVRGSKRRQGDVSMLDDGGGGGGWFFVLLLIPPSPDLQLGFKVFGESRGWEIFRPFWSNFNFGSAAATPSDVRRRETVRVGRCGVAADLELAKKMWANRAAPRRWFDLSHHIFL